MELNKKAGAEMWWIIIGAVIALVVLIVLMVIFTGKTNVLGEGLSACESKGGICISGNTCPANTLKASAFECEANYICCLGTPTDKDCEQVEKIIMDSKGKSWCK